MYADAFLPNISFFYRRPASRQINRSDHLTEGFKKSEVVGQVSKEEQLAERARKPQRAKKRKGRLERNERLKIKIRMQSTERRGRKHLPSWRAGPVQTGAYAGLESVVLAGMRKILDS